jgi:hypothetical protein
MSSLYRVLFIAITLAATSHFCTAQLTWTTVVNNGTAMPGSVKTFNSYNQPAVNSAGLVVFRARSKGGEGGEPTHGIYKRDMGVTGSPTIRIFDRTSLVPAPNNLGSTFIEFPSFPRIGLSGSTIVTRGRSQPVWTYLLPDGSETRTGTSGVYVQPGDAAMTGASQLGAVTDFSFFEVPGALPGTRFDEFPGAPSVSDPYVVFKGNYTEGSFSKTGVFYRDLRTPPTGPASVRLIASSHTRIPNQGPHDSLNFGSTAPPTAAADYAVFVGWDNEENPTIGGIYEAKLQPNPVVKTLVALNSQVPGEPAGTQFNRLGEGLSFDGRYVAFWAAWGTETFTVTLYCPTEGNKQRTAFCNAQYPNGYLAQVPVHQGIFVYDTLLNLTYAVARTGPQFDDFLYWNFSGMVPGGMEEDGEPARWRSAAFAAVSGSKFSFHVVLKGTKAGSDGLYFGSGPGLAATVKLLDTTTPGQSVDPAAAGSTITSVGIERDGFRNGWLAITASMLNASTGESWAGIYVTRIP